MSRYAECGLGLCGEASGSGSGRGRGKGDNDGRVMNGLR